MSAEGDTVKDMRWESGCFYLEFVTNELGVALK